MHANDTSQHHSKSQHLVLTTRSALSYFPVVLSKIPRRGRRFAGLLYLLMMVMAGLESLTVGAIAIFISSLSNPEKALESKYIVMVGDFFSVQHLLKPTSFIIILGVIVLVLVILNKLCLATLTYWRIRFSQWIGCIVGNKLLSGFLTISYSWHLNKNPADLIQSLSWRKYYSMYIDLFMQVLTNLLITTFLLILIISLNPLATITALTFLGLLAFFLYSIIGKLMDCVSRTLHNTIVEINRQVHKSIHGVKEVKMFGKEGFIVSSFNKDVHDYARYIAKQRLLALSPAWFFEVFGLSLLVLISGYFYVAYAEIPTAFALYIVTIWKVVPSISKIITAFSQVRKVYPFLDQEEHYFADIKTLSGSTELQSEPDDIDFAFTDSITLENVSYRYESADDYALKDISLTIPKGSTVGILGPSGAGKSTLLNILICMLQPTDGTVAVDGASLTQATCRLWQREIGYVSQEPYIFAGSLAQNIAFGASATEVDHSLVLQSAEQAALGDFIKELPLGLETPLGERGVMFSGGQRQRVAIARALYRKPSVLVFDEATSSLDSKTETEILETIYGFKSNKTIIIVAHNMETLNKCDKVFWIDHGQLRAWGPARDIILEYQSS